MRGSAVFRTGVAPGGALAGPWVRNELWRKARAVPSLDLRFAEQKSLVDATTGQNLVTITRASSGTYVGSDGLIKTATTNEPRFDHNPTTGESLGLRMEVQRTNLLLRSEDISTIWTSFSNTVAVNSAIAPDGQITADTLIPNNGSSTSGVTQVISGGLPDSTVYTFSAFVKSAGLANVNLQFYNKANTFHGSKNLNTQTGQLSGSEFNCTTSVVALPDGWYRLIIANVNSGIGATAPNARVVCSSTGNGTSGIYVWGAQLEAGAFPTSYIPTTTAAATRSEDVASITGSAFSSWYRQDEGTVFVELGPYADGGSSFNAGFFQIDDGSTANTIRSFGGATLFPVLAVVSSSVNQVYLSAGTLTPTSVTRLAGAFRTNDFARAFNGTNINLDTSGTVPMVSQMLIANGSGGVSPLNGTIRRLTFFPQRLPNSTLQQITQ